MRSIEGQIAAMAVNCPEFTLVTRSDRAATWEGLLAPVKRTFKVQVAYRVPVVVEMFTTLSVQPRVQVLQPLLERHPEFEEGPIPHVYWSKKDPGLPFLCLFDPAVGEWSVDDLIAETTIPWAARWLLFYEGWLTTGKWRGGGRHPTATLALSEEDPKRLAPV